MKKEQVIIFSVLAVVILAVISYFSYFSDKPLFAPQQEDSADIPKEQETQINQQESSTTIPRKQLYALPSAFEEQRTDIFPYGELSSSSNYLQDLYFRDNIIAYQGFEEDLYDGYIVKLKEKPSAVISVENQDSDNLDSLLDEQANKIANEQDTLINNFQLSPIDRFDKVINAITVQDLTQEQITQLESQGYKVSRNLQAEITLMDSVPLINADDVWLLDANGQLCAQTGRPCLTGQEIKIGIIDTGVDYTHQDLGGCFGQGCKVIDGYDFVNRDNDPMDDHGHGTHVAATAAGNSILKGVAPDANIVAYKVCDQYGDCFYDDIIASIERAVDPDQNGRFDDHLDVISLSIGGPGDPDDDPSIAIDNAVNIGVVAVIAAANSGPSERTIGSPGTARKSITIGAVDKQKNMADFSSRGPVVWQNQLGQSLSLIKPDVVAPGVNICAAQWDNAWSWLQCLDNEHVAISGTSMATPHVSGMAALILQRSPNYSPEQVKATIRNTAHLLPNPEKITTQGTGLIDALDSVFFDNPVIVSLDPIEQENLEIDISGRIIGNVQNYNLAYAPNRPLSELRPEDWTIIPTLTPSTTPTIQTYQPSTILARDFNLLTIPDGEYLIKLEATDNLGRKFYDYGFLEINKFDFIEPLNNDIINPKDDLKIKIENRFNLPIDNFIVEYSFEGSPWTSQGVTTNINLLEATLAENTITQSGFLETRTSITRGGIVDEFQVKDVYADITLKEGWPVRVLRAYDPYQGQLVLWWSGLLEPAIGNVAGDDTNEVIVYQGGNPPKILIFDFGGTLIRTIDVGSVTYEGVPAGNLQHPVLANLDSDSYNEIIVAIPDFNYNQFFVYSFNGDGTIVSGWPIILPMDYHPTIMVADLNADGQTEVIMKGNDAWEDEQLFIIQQNGALLRQMSIGNSDLNSPINGVPAVGNFDNDNDLEIVVGTAGEVWNGQNWINEGKLYIYNLDGTLVNNWPITVPGQVFSSPVVGDVDNDGIDEIVVGVLYNSNTFPDPRYGGLHIFNRYGQELPGWPREMGWNFWSTPSLFDKEGDGTLEIAVSRLGFVTYVFDYLGNELPGWPQYTSWNDYYSSIAGSVNNGDLGIVTTAGDGFYAGGYNPRGNTGGVYAWDVRGNALPSFPKKTEVAAQAPAVILDIDNDGLTEVIASSDLDYDWLSRKYKLRGSLYVWETASPFNEENQEWPVFHHDKQLTGCYDCQPKQTQCYAIRTNGNFYKINQENATREFISSIGLRYPGALEASRNGKLYVVDYFSPALYEINPNNGTKRLIGNINNLIFEGGLAIASDNTAYLVMGGRIVGGLPADPALLSLNLSSGATNVIGRISGVNRDISGLTWRNDGLLVGLDSVTNSLLIINPVNANASVLTSLTPQIGNVGGITSIDGETGFFATASLSQGGSDELYSINLFTGEYNLVGNLGSRTGEPGISGLACMLS